MKHLSQYITEFQGWPDWDDADEISSVNDVVTAIKADKEFQKYHRWDHFYWSNENMKINDYLNDDELELEDKELICAELELTGMLNTESSMFEFVDPMSKKVVGAYDDEFGDDDISILLCYDPWKIPKELEPYGHIDKKTHYFYVWSYDCPSEPFEKRRGRVPHIGLLWVMSTNSGCYDGYWYRDKEAKKDMMEYCGFEEFKKGNLLK